MLTLVPRYRFANAPTEFLGVGSDPSLIRQQSSSNSPGYFFLFPKREKAIQFKPDYPYAWNGRGCALHVLKRYDEALKSYDKAISIQPDFQLAIDNCKRLLTPLGRSN